MSRAAPSRGFRPRTHTAVALAGATLASTLHRPHVFVPKQVAPSVRRDAQPIASDVAERPHHVTNEAPALAAPLAAQSALPASVVTGAGFAAAAGCGSACRRLLRRAAPRKDTSRLASSSGTKELEVASDVEAAEAARLAAQLQLEAAKLRADVEALEEAQREDIEKQRAVLFRSLDLDKSGALDVEELRVGLKETGVVALGETVAKRLLDSLDTNQDGVLQPEEFDIPRVEAKLAEFRAEERAREEAERAAAQEAREQEEMRQRFEDYVANLPVRNEDTSLQTRLACVLAYLLPAMDVVRYGLPLALALPGATWLSSYLTALSVPMALFNSAPFGLGYLLLFIGLQGVAANPEQPALLRFHCRQSIIMDIALFVPGIIAFLVGIVCNLAQVQIPYDLELVGNSLVFFNITVSVAYCVGCSLFGVMGKGIPYLAETAEEALKDTRPSQDTDSNRE